jgi:hypothetical protein
MSGSLEIAKELTGGQVAAILNKVAGEGSDEEKRERLGALLRDELEVQLVERILKLFDKNGRRIPSKGLQAAVCDPDRDFHFVQPQLVEVAHYAARLVRFQEAFRVGPVMSAADFEGRSKKLIAEIKGNKNLANLLSGVHLPVILPQLESEVADYGETLEEVFVPAARSAYKKQFPGRKFYNYWEGKLAGKVSIIPESRHDRLIAKMQAGPLVALYFPAPLQGFSMLASREQMATLSEELWLAGGFDTLAAIAMYPDVLARDFHTPGCDLSALYWQSPDDSLSLGALGDGLVFFCGGVLGRAPVSFSSCLLFLGSA